MKKEFDRFIQSATAEQMQTLVTRLKKEKDVELNEIISALLLFIG